jgi:hypothetical protein
MWDLVAMVVVLMVAVLQLQQLKTLAAAAVVKKELP